MGGKRKIRKGRLVALSGACHSGKTTALNQIKAHFDTNIDYFGENIRDLIPPGLSIDQLREQPDVYVDVLHAAVIGKIHREDAAMDDDRVTVFDRSLADSLYYFTRYLHVGDLSPDKVILYYEILGNFMESIRPDRYDLVIFLKPIPIPSTHNDPHRPKELPKIQLQEAETLSMLSTIFRPVLLVDRQSVTIKNVISSIDALR